MIRKKREYLFVCGDVEFWTPIIKRIASDYNTHIQASHFEVCDSNSIPNKNFSYFNRFHKIYTLNKETTDRIQKTAHLENHRFCIIRLTGNPKQKEKLEDILFSLLFQTA